MLVMTGLALAATARPDYFCNYAKVSGSHAVVVHSRHADRSRAVTHLMPGTIVYICDEARNDDGTNRWVQVSLRLVVTPVAVPPQDSPTSVPVLVGLVGCASVTSIFCQVNPCKK